MPYLFDCQSAAIAGFITSWAAKLQLESQKLLCRLLVSTCDRDSREAIGKVLIVREPMNRAEAAQSFCKAARLEPQFSPRGSPRLPATW